MNRRWILALAATCCAVAAQAQSTQRAIYFVEPKDRAHNCLGEQARASITVQVQ
jgi:hypothetical protein